MIQVVVVAPPVVPAVVVGPIGKISKTFTRARTTQSMEPGFIGRGRGRGENNAPKHARKGSNDVNKQNSTRGRKVAAAINKQADMEMPESSLTTIEAAAILVGSRKTRDKGEKGGANVLSDGFARIIT